MPRQHDDLFGQIASFPALVAAARRAARGKRRNRTTARFLAGLERNALRLERELKDRRWQPGPYTVMQVRDPKPRRISAAPFRDRVVHHALCAVVEPIFERGFIFDSYANRKDKGTHAGIARYEQYRDCHRYVLRCDIFRYFPAIDHEILKRDLRRRIACQDTLWLLDTIIDSSNPQEPVHLHFPGDDLLAPIERQRGLPIGNLTSQFLANVYLDPLDHFVKEVLGAPYLRYVDDFALFADDADQLQDWRMRIVRFLEGRRLVLHPVKTMIVETSRDAEFLGLTLLHGGQRRLPEDAVRRFRNQLRGLRDRWNANTIELPEVQARVNAWIAHADHADTWRLRHAIFEGGMFDPALDLPGRGRQ